MSDDKRARLKQMLQSGEIRLQPLTFPQRELWEAMPVPVGDPANHICSVIYVRGKMPAEMCVYTLEKVVERQEVLRQAFLPGKDRPFQMIRNAGEASYRFMEVPADTTDAQVEAHVQDVFREPFDLMHGPLFRVVQISRTPEDHALAFAIHHSIADGWSLGVFVQDLASAYVMGLMGLNDPLPPVPMTYAAWDAAERAMWTPAELERCAAFWKPRLAGTGRLWEPASPADGGTEQLSRWRTHFPVELTKSIRALTRRSHATLFSTALAAFQVTLCKWTGKDDFAVGTPVANRTKPAVRETMGYFSGVVPMRCCVQRDRTFLEFLRGVHEATMDNFANAMPFAELIKAIGEQPAPGHNPVYDVRFALQNHPVPDVSIPGMSLKLRMRSTGTARFDLGCELTEENDTLEVVWLYKESRFSQPDIASLHEMYQSVLSACGSSPETGVSALIN